MDTSNRYFIATSALSAFLGAMLIVALLPPLDDAVSRPAVDVAEELRPTLVASEPTLRPTVVSAPPLEPYMRFTFVPPDASPFEIPEQVAALTGPEAWSAEIKLDEAAKKRWSSLPGATAKASKRRYTLKGRLAEIAPVALARVQAKFHAAKMQWPPVELTYLAIKDERALDVYAKSESGAWSFVHRYKVLGASGRSGPKLVRGDKQVPEGVYRISYLNPNSAFHVSMRVSYPNAFDREMAKRDGRKDLGGDIMIHGKNLSAGCLAVGDESAEELFVLANEVGLKNVQVVIAPTDLRSKGPPALASAPSWMPKLYTELAATMTQFKPPPQSEPSLLSLLGL